MNEIYFYNCIGTVLVFAVSIAWNINNEMLDWSAVSGISLVLKHVKADENSIPELA